MERINTDIIIAGAGPAGATMALMLADSGVGVTLVDKDRFPRDKICGDALSGKSVKVLERMPGGIFERFLEEIPSTPCSGIRFISPEMVAVDVPFVPGSSGAPSGFLCRRRDFDGFLVSQVSRFPSIRLLQGERISNVSCGPESVTAKTERYELTGKMIAAADGVHSTVRNLLGLPKQPGSDRCTGIRAYFEGVEGFPPGNYLELFYLKELLPSYFWIFPEVEGRCNAGLAMMQDDISENRINLGSLFNAIVSNHPVIGPRFANARMAGRAEAHALPLGMRPGPRSGDRYLLLGDAASLVDPFTGEGIGNAMAGGEVAARVVRECYIKNDFSAAALKAYDIQLDRRIGGELRTSATLQRWAGSPRLFNAVIRKAARNNAFRDLISAAFSDHQLRGKIVSPLSLTKALFNL